MRRAFHAAAIGLAAFALILTLHARPARAIQGGTGQPSIPCNPTGAVLETVTVGPNGTTSNSPNVDVLADQVVSEPMDVGAEYPAVLGGNDGGLQLPGPCASSFDIGLPLPPISIPTPTGPIPSLPPVPTPSTTLANLPAIPFAMPFDCRGDAAVVPPPRCGGPLNCKLPFCGRDIIFVDGLSTGALTDLVKARYGYGLPASLQALQRWPQHPAAFTSPSGYFRKIAELDWSGFILRKLGPAYRKANAAKGPRFLVVPWASTQRMEIGIHAVLAQTAQAIQHGTNVKTLDMNQIGTPIVPAGLAGAGFCGRGCIVVSYSTGGPLSIAAMNVAANGSRPWVSSGLRQLPRSIKGHVAFHPALDGSEIAWHALTVSSGGAGCAAFQNMVNAIHPGNSLPSAINGCVAANDLAQSVLHDLIPPVMHTLWRPIMAQTPSSTSVTVPTVVVAGTHPTKLQLLHWAAPALPGYDDGVLSVDSQLGRIWAPGLMPRSVALGLWPATIFRYYDRGTPNPKAIPYFLDQNYELVRRPAAHAAAPNPFLTPVGMILPSVSQFEIPQASSGLPNVFSFLQSTASHQFLLDVGSGSASTPTLAGDSCAPDSYNYENGSFGGSITTINEESRAVFDSSAYTPRGRYDFVMWEANSAVGGHIPILSPNLKGAVEGEKKGRYVRLRIRLPFVTLTKDFWIWKREYMRMSGWRCRDEIDYAFDFAFRR